MENKVALITGSTSGIGLGIAKNFAKNKAKLVINGFASSELVAEVIKELKDLGAADVLYHNADLSRSEEIKDMFDKIFVQFGRVDILVNNAGIQHVSPIDEFPAEKWEAIIRIDLIASFYTIKYAIASMKQNGWGRVINIASAHALVASPFKSAYVAAKHGLSGLTKTVALEVAEYNITANAICPGYVKTPLVLGQVANTAKARGITEDDVIKKVLLAAQATKKFVEVEEIAALTTFLCTNEAASITGANLSIDGGWTAA
jgi:3-hydroxybutyrate dehydrogenase